MMLPKKLGCYRGKKKLSQLLVITLPMQNILMDLGKVLVGKLLMDLLMHTLSSVVGSR